MDTNFELEFRNELKNSMAAIPFPLILNDEGFTITMRIQFYKKGDTGTILSLFAVR